MIGKEIVRVKLVELSVGFSLGVLGSVLSTMVHVPRVEYNRTLHLGGAGGGCTWYFDPNLPAHVGIGH